MGIQPEPAWLWANISSWPVLVSRSSLLVLSSFLFFDPMPFADSGVVASN